MNEEERKRKEAYRKWKEGKDENYDMVELMFMLPYQQMNLRL